MTRNWILKVFGTPLVMTLFFVGYFYLLKNPHFPVTTMPLTWLDEAIPMQFWAWFPYLSLWLYVSLPSMFQPNIRALFYFGFSIGVVCGIGLLCFYFFPSSIPSLYKPPEADLSWMRGVDAAGNACPSLHVAASVFSGLWISHQLKSVSAPWLLRAINFLWCLAIVYSTMATKQHVALDVLAGSLLGSVGGVLSLWGLHHWILKRQS